MASYLTGWGFVVGTTPTLMFHEFYNYILGILNILFRLSCILCSVRSMSWQILQISLSPPARVPMVLQRLWTPLFVLLMNYGRDPPASPLCSIVARMLTSSAGLDTHHQCVGEVGQQCIIKSCRCVKGSGHEISIRLQTYPHSFARVGRLDSPMCPGWETLQLGSSSISCRCTADSLNSEGPWFYSSVHVFSFSFFLFLVLTQVEWALQMICQNKKISTMLLYCRDYLKETV